MPQEKHQTMILIVLLIVLAIVIFLGVGGFTLWYFTQQTNQPQNEEKINRETLTAEGWQTYSNSRYNFSCKYPVSFEKQESDNGDGATFTSTSPRITISAYAEANSLNQTLAEYLDNLAADLGKENSGFKELSKSDKEIAGKIGQERVWRYQDSVEGADTIRHQVTILKDNAIYTIQMTIYYSDYEEYKPMFEEILGSFNF